MLTQASRPQLNQTLGVKKSMMTRATVFFLLTWVVGSSAPAKVVAFQAPWTIRVIVNSEEPVCPEALVTVSLRNSSGETVGSAEISVSGGEITDQEWTVSRQPEARYTLLVETFSCSGLPVDKGELSIDTVPIELHRAVYVAMEYRKARPSLNYLEADAYYDARSILSVSKDAEGVTVKNSSARPVKRCSNQMIDRVDREFLINGEWSGFNHPRSYSWPEEVKALGPTEVMTLKDPSVFTIHHDPKAERVRPDAKRYVLFTELDPGQFRVFNKAKVPLGLPGCNVYYVEAAVTDDDPLLEAQ